MATAAAAAAQRSPKLVADATITVAELQEAIEDFLNESLSRNLRKLLERGMQGHIGNAHGKPKSLRQVYRLFEGLASLAHSSFTCPCTFLESML